MEVHFRRFDVLDDTFDDFIINYSDSFYNLLSGCYGEIGYYGDDYHLKRIKEGRAIVYLASVGNKVVGASYVKRNGRRGGTAVHANWRRQGIAADLIRMSLHDFPKQYSILRANNARMISLIECLGFQPAENVNELKEILGEDFGQLHNFEKLESMITFSRLSEVRSVDRNGLALYFHREGIAGAGKLNGTSLR